MILIYIGQANWSLHIRGTNTLTIGIHTLFVLLCMDAANHYMTPSPRTFPECSLRGLKYFGDPVRRVKKQMMSKNVQQYYTLKCPIRDLLPNVFSPKSWLSLLVESFLRSGDIVRCFYSFRIICATLSRWITISNTRPASVWAVTIRNSFGNSTRHLHVLRILLLMKLLFTLITLS